MEPIQIITKSKLLCEGCGNSSAFGEIVVLSVILVPVATLHCFSFSGTVSSETFKKLSRRRILKFDTTEV